MAGGVMSNEKTDGGFIVLKGIKITKEISMGRVIPSAWFKLSGEWSHTMKQMLQKAPSVEFEDDLAADTGH
jgi:hypothetical protein